MRNAILLLIILLSLSCKAQLQDARQEEMYDYQVKGIGEFMARFNSDEHLKFDMGLPDSLSQRKKDVMSVCNYEISRTIPDFENTLNGFISSIEKNDIKLNFSDTTWFASAECNVQYKNNPIRLNILLTPYEARPRRFCWALIDVGGKDVNKLADTTKWFGISPTDNELDFLELVGKSETQRNNFPGFRKPGKEIDYLSAFVALVQAGVVTINYCEKIKYYFFNVPGYIFTVDNFLRESSNSGWLISDIIPTDEENKKTIVKQIVNQ